jgi:hypothetical protein
MGKCGVLLERAPYTHITSRCIAVALHDGFPP